VTMATDRESLLEQLTTLLTWLECGDTGGNSERPELFGSHDEHEWLLRLTGLVMTLLRQHDTDADGRCDHCHEPRSGWRAGLPRRRAQCQVTAIANAFARSAVDNVWWQALSLRGDDVQLTEVRAWLEGVRDDHAAVTAKHAQVIAEERFRPSNRGELPTDHVWPVDAETQELPRVPPGPLVDHTGDEPQLHEPCPATAGQRRRTE
jgi:hypothetical protein